MANVMTDETKAKLSAVHKKLAQDPARLAKLREIAQDPVNKEKHSAVMKAKWADPVWRAAQLAKMKRTPAPAEVENMMAPAPAEVETKAKAKKKRVITPEQKAKYAANRKAKREAAKKAD